MDNKIGWKTYFCVAIQVPMSKRVTYVFVNYPIL